MTNNNPDDDKLDIPQPFKMAPNAWEMGYYDGYNTILDQRFWSSDHKLTRNEYHRGWNEGSLFRMFETAIAQSHKEP